MKLVLAGSFAGLLLGAAAQAGQPGVPLGNPTAGIGSIVTPYRFSPAPKPLSPAEQQGAYGYRLQLQRQQQQLETLQSQGRLDAYGRGLLSDTHSELLRMNRALTQ